MILALAGGVGGAKLAAGLAAVLRPEQLCVAVNTGDDFVHLGLHVSPDLDTVMYTLAGVANPVTGWGLAGESWAFMEALERLGGPAWFRLGDRDLATNVERTRRLALGETLSAVTQVLCERFGVRHAVVPMSDQPVRTFVCAGGAEMEFQHYFVRERCEPRVESLAYHGAAGARPSPALAAALASPALEGIVICPSNPYLSIAPLLAIPGVRESMAQRAPVLGVSPIIAGRALKGPAAKIMRELGAEPSALEIARYYRGVIDTLLIDSDDAALVPAIGALGIRAVVTGTVMTDAASRERLAAECVAQLRRGIA